VLLVLEQQVSLASAVLALDEAELRAVGFSRQKAGYTRGLADAVRSGLIDLDALSRLPANEVRASLTRLRGIGPWTADVYLTMALCRPDAFPLGDLALLVSAQRVKRLDTRPTPLELKELAESWRPHRATAARILWHEYLSERPRRSREAPPQ
jgi:DNA-3-methyladenine glycosylase II